MFFAYRDGRLGVHVGAVGSDTGGAHNVVKRQLGDVGGHLHEHGEGLADAAGGTEDGHLALGADGHVARGQATDGHGSNLLEERHG